MDSGTFDDYGGVEHAEYCFQVYFLFSILHIANFSSTMGIWVIHFVITLLNVCPLD